MDLHLKSLFGRFNEQFGSGPGLGPGSGSCLVDSDGVTSEFIKSLYKAAAALYRSDPWKRLRPTHLLGVRVGKDSDKQPFPCAQFIGGDGGDLALYLFRSQSDALRATRPRKTLRVPNVEIFRVTFEKESIMFPSHRKMIKSLALEASGAEHPHFPVFDVVSCDSGGDLRFRNPRFEELRFAYGVMRAVALVHPLLQEMNTQAGGAEVLVPHLVCFEPFVETVDVQWPVEMARAGSGFVAVAVSHPPGHSYRETSVPSSAASTPTKVREPAFQEDGFAVVDLDLSAGLRYCGMCDREFHGDQQSVYCSSCSCS